MYPNWQGAELRDGYAPFCKHIFVPNFVGATLGALPITKANRHLLHCGYSRRRPEEMPVLTRWSAHLYHIEATVPEAIILDDMPSM